MKKKVVLWLCFILLLVLLLCSCAGASYASSQESSVAPIQPSEDLLFPGGTVCSADAATLRLIALAHKDVDAVIPLLQQMPGLIYLDLGSDTLPPSGGSEMDALRDLSWDDIKAIQNACPQAAVKYAFSFGGRSFTTLDTKWDLNHISMDDNGAAVREILPCMTRCTYLDMDFCDVDSEHMAEIRDAYPNMEVVWRVFFGRDCSVRTDVERILASNLNHVLMDQNTRQLKYCTKVKLFDVGHNTYLRDFSFLSYMPDLEVVIVSMTGFSDLSVLSNAKNLEYLEFHSCKEGMDLSPLVNNPNLEHICCCFLGDVQGWEAIKTLKKLQRFHMGCYTRLPEGAVEELQEALPNCDINTTNTMGSIGDWRWDEKNNRNWPRYDKLCQQFEYANYQNVCSSWFNDPKFFCPDGSSPYSEKYWYFPALETDNG